MVDIDRNSILKYLENKRKAYENRLNKCNTENNDSKAITYEIRLKEITDLLIYLNKVDKLESKRFLNRIEDKRNELRKQRDQYLKSTQILDAAHCEIRILPLENIVRHLMVGNFNVRTEQRETTEETGKDISETQGSGGDLPECDGKREAPCETGNDEYNHPDDKIGNV